MYIIATMYRVYWSHAKHTHTHTHTHMQYMHTYAVMHTCKHTCTHTHTHTHTELHTCSKLDFQATIETTPCLHIQPHLSKPFVCGHFCQSIIPFALSPHLSTCFCLYVLKTALLCIFHNYFLASDVRVHGCEII